jgi:hypothetical protein
VFVQKTLSAKNWEFLGEQRCKEKWQNFVQKFTKIQEDLSVTLHEIL